MSYSHHGADGSPHSGPGGMFGCSQCDADRAQEGMDELERMTRRLALDIIARRADLDAEAGRRQEARRRGLKGCALPGRGNAQVTADRHVADGMALGLSYLLGQPGEHWAAEDYIREIAAEQETAR